MTPTFRFRPGDLIELMMNCKHATRDTLPRGTRAIVTQVHRRLLAVELLDRDERCDRIVPAGVCVLVERPADIRCAWNLLAALKRIDPAFDLEALRQSPVLPPQEV